VEACGEPAEKPVWFSDAVAKGKELSSPTEQNRFKGMLARAIQSSRDGIRMQKTMAWGKAALAPGA
jgi:hypothetical protein